MGSGSWRKTLYSMWVAQLLSIMGFSFVLPFMPFYIQELGIHDEKLVAKWAGILVAGTGIAMAVTSPIWGVIADRRGRKMMVLRSMFGGAVVMALMAFARDVTDLLVLRILQGVLTGTITASVALVASVTPKDRSGYALGLMQSAVLIGGSIGPLVGAAIAHYVSYRVAFLAAGVAVLAGGLCVKCLATENFTPRREGEEPSVTASFGALFAVGAYVLAIATVFQIHFAMTAPAPIFPIFVRHLCLDPKQADLITGLIFSAAGFAAALSVWKLGGLSDTWGHRRMLVASCLLAGLVTVPQAVAPNVWVLCALRVLLGAAAAGIMPAANAIIRAAVPAHSLGKAYGVTSAVGALGFGLGPLAGGYMAAHWGLPIPFVFSGALLIVIALIVMRFRGLTATAAKAEARVAVVAQAPEP